MGYNISTVWTTISQNPQTMLKPLALDPNPNGTWKFDFTTHLGRAGLYSSYIQQMEDLHKNMIFPAKRMVLEAVLANTISNPEMLREGLHVLNLLDENALKATAHSYTKLLWGKLASFGDYCPIGSSLFIQIKTAVTVMKSIINGYTLYKAFGWSFRILEACFPRSLPIS